VKYLRCCNTRGEHLVQNIDCRENTGGSFLPNGGESRIILEAIVPFAFSYLLPSQQLIAESDRRFALKRSPLIRAQLFEGVTASSQIGNISGHLTSPPTVEPTPKAQRLLLLHRMSASQPLSKTVGGAKNGNTRLVPTTESRAAKWYPADDIKQPKKSRKTPRPTKLRASVFSLLDVTNEVDAWNGMYCSCRALSWKASCDA
jgi:hypothetical protein